ncbi:MAG: riboflavin synthase [Gammaproteobacteria bacterium]|nr:riboflavin synthase [Gammaproteobacteria bacterium]
MFSGIIQHIGSLQQRSEHNGDVTLLIAATDDWFAATRPGDSIAVNGVCLTARTVQPDQVAFDVSAETLRLTTLGHIPLGGLLNLEAAVRAGDPLGGHLVSGHVDATAEVLERAPDARSERIWISLPDKLARLVAVKGSICVDGTSLTVNEVESARFSVNIVPHTIDATVISEYGPGTRVNLEADLIARYVARILEQDR